MNLIKVLNTQEKDILKQQRKRGSILVSRSFQKTEGLCKILPEVSKPKYYKLESENSSGIDSLLQSGKEHGLYSDFDSKKQKYQGADKVRLDKIFSGESLITESLSEKRWSRVKEKTNF